MASDLTLNSGGSAGIAPLDCPDCGEQIPWEKTKCPKCGLDKDLYFEELRVIYRLVCNRKISFKIAITTLVVLSAISFYGMEHQFYTRHPNIAYASFTLVCVAVLVFSTTNWVKKRSAILRFKQLHSEIQRTHNGKKTLRVIR